MWLLRVSINLIVHNWSFSQLINFPELLTGAWCFIYGFELICFNNCVMIIHFILCFSLLNAIYKGKWHLNLINNIKSKSGGVPFYFQIYKAEILKWNQLTLYHLHAVMPSTKRHFQNLSFLRLAERSCFESLNCSELLLEVLRFQYYFPRATSKVVWRYWYR